MCRNAHALLVVFPSNVVSFSLAGPRPAKAELKYSVMGWVPPQQEYELDVVVDYLRCDGDMKGDMVVKLHPPASDSERVRRSAGSDFSKWHSLCCVWGFYFFARAAGPMPPNVPGNRCVARKNILSIPLPCFYC